LKLADFGLCQKLPDGRGLKTRCGSANYVAPEIIQNQPYDGTLVDCWSVGVICYTILCGCFPFDDESNSRLYRKVLNAHVNFESKLAISE
jgi:serine/threonine protein kinase